MPRKYLSGDPFPPKLGGVRDKFFNSHSKKKDSEIESIFIGHKPQNQGTIKDLLKNTFFHTIDALGTQYTI